MATGMAVITHLLFMVEHWCYNGHAVDVGDNTWDILGCWRPCHSLSLQYVKFNNFIFWTIKSTDPIQEPHGFLRGYESQGDGTFLLLCLQRDFEPSSLIKRIKIDMFLSKKRGYNLPTYSRTTVFDHGRKTHTLHPKRVSCASGFGRKQDTTFHLLVRERERESIHWLIIIFPKNVARIGALVRPSFLDMHNNIPKSSKIILVG